MDSNGHTEDALTSRTEEENQQILFSHVEKEVIENSRLASRNAELERQLECMSKNAASRSDVGPDLEQATSEALTVSADEHGQLAEKYAELSKKYQDLSQKIKYLERKNTAVMQKNKDMKESVRAWQDYADRQSGKYRPKNEARAEEDRPRLSMVPLVEDVPPHMPSSPKSLATARTPLSLADARHSSPTPIALLGAESDHGEVSEFLGLGHHCETGGSGSRSGSITPKPTSHLRLSPRQSTDTEMTHPSTSSRTMNGSAEDRLQSHLKAGNPNSSQTTVDENTEQTTRQTEIHNSSDDDDRPQFVSARSLKRKRDLPSKSDVQGERSSDGTPVKPFRVKEEPRSSPPNIHNLIRKETIDLDDPTSMLLRTPRHPKRKSSVYSTATGTARHQRSSSAPFSQVVKQENLRYQSLEESADIYARRNNLATTENENRAYSEPSDATENVTDVLRHLDPNTLGEVEREHLSKRTKRGETGRPHGHGILSESGEEPPPIDENTSRLTPSVARAKLNRKLQGPRGQTKTPSTTKIKIEQNPTSPDSSRTTQTPPTRTGLRSAHSAGRSAAQDDFATDERPQWRMKAHQPGSSLRKSPVLPSKKLGPLRSKPVTELTVQDFKPNPVYNQGYSYAFSETVRKRGDRMCLPGCTNPQCCGSTFRTFAEAQAPLPFSQEEALLEDYLGDAYNNMRTTQMSSEERQELVLQARTKKMAKEAGKHREAYERRRTPPGFWRVDFPTTQEQQEDREQAKEQEKKIVQERWLEAQRKGGKWIFRDE
jgi:hypothetical protein